ncbi:chromate transporter [Mycolicibacterium palauense]|uniref:chromate transporter n=1 Tax=Mycolicibacterium palauense TaxID=2034511 RepID=UPI000BFEF0BB|nr:chromate transporter [Mycolicibacterium palauense]
MSEPQPRVSHLQLALAFNHIAVASFGGGLSAWSREVLVAKKGWIGEEEFLSAMTMCRILPGSNQINLAVFAGTKLRGGSGAIAAILGLVTVPVTLMLVVGYFYFRFKEVPAVNGALHGASAAAVALTVAMVIKTGRVCLTGIIPVAMFAAAFVLSGLLRWPLVVVLALIAPVGVVWAWPRGRTGDGGESGQSTT